MDELCRAIPCEALSFTAFSSTVTFVEPFTNTPILEFEFIVLPPINTLDDSNVLIPSLPFESTVLAMVLVVPPIVILTPPCV